jgi:uncharacterized protein (TIGR00255 family)
LKEGLGMPKSMTGYGRGDVTRYNRRFIVEIKSVNHRYNEISIRTPRIFNHLEEVIRKKLSEEITRGKVDVYITFETFSSDDVKIKYNAPLAQSYYTAINEMKEALSLPDDVTANMLTRFPDVLLVDKNVDDEQANNEMKEILLLAIDEALNTFIKMRVREGEALTSDILQKLDVIEENAKLVAERAPFVAEDYKTRLAEKINTALSGSGFDENRFIMEVTLFADKACIDEELTRLSSHISQMRLCFSQRDAIGRKLDFLTQEMNREINTIASKSNDIEITKIAVDLKSDLEKIREQIQNIE